jgi:hypothetical protein
MGALIYTELGFTYADGNKIRLLKKYALVKFFTHLLGL